MILCWCYHSIMYLIILSIRNMRCIGVGCRCWTTMLFLHIWWRNNIIFCYTTIHVHVSNLSVLLISYLCELGCKISIYILTITQHRYVGTCVGDISILKVDQRQRRLFCMQYRIPFMESYGKTLCEQNFCISKLIS